MNPAADIAKHLHRVCARLQPYVDRIWSWESNKAAPLPIFLPGTGAEFIIHYRKPFLAETADGGWRRLPQTHFACLRTRSCRLLADGPVGFLSARMRGSSLRHLGSRGLAELIDGFEPAALAFGPEVEFLPEALASADGFPERAELVEQFLLRQAEHHRAARDESDALIDALYYGSGYESIEELSQRVGLSRRQLERRVLATSGLRPKQFQGLARLHHTVRELMLAAQPEYLDVALARGYYDQAHFIHDFRKFTGRSPGEVLTPRSFMSHFYNTPLSR